MRLAILDTNVIVAAGIAPAGAPARLMMDWILEGRVQLVTCPCIVEEYTEVVRRRKFRRYQFPPAWLGFVIEESLLLPDPDPWPLPLPDTADAPFLGLAHQSGAWLITGNLRHFPPRLRQGVTVLSPSQYLEHLIGN